MWRTGAKRVRRAGLRLGVAGGALVLGLLLFGTPVAMAASSVGVDRPAGVALLTQDAPPSGVPSAPPPGSGQPGPAVNQRALIGTAGFVLIGLVLLSRRVRKRPVFGTWRPKK